MGNLVTLLVFYWLICALLVAPFTCTSAIPASKTGTQHHRAVR